MSKEDLLSLLKRIYDEDMDEMNGGFLNDILFRELHYALAKEDLI